MVETYVRKRNGTTEPVSLDKITARVKSLLFGLDERYIEVTKITQKVSDYVCENISTTEIDTLAAETISSMCTSHPDYGILAGRIATSNLQKETYGKFSEGVEALSKTGILNTEFTKFVSENKDALDSMVKPERDFDIEYFGFKTLEKSYLLRIFEKTFKDGVTVMVPKIVETPQYLFMRVAVALYKDVGLDMIEETYNELSSMMYIHATPTLFNAGMKKQQLASCFLIAMKDDSIEGIYDTLKECAIVSKYAGGIGLNISNIRSSGTIINGTNGMSNGIVPMLTVYNATAKYVDQGGGKRKGSIAAYIEPWHPDIEDFLLMKQPHMKEEQRALDLFYALWIPDLFMKRAMDNSHWTFFDPHLCPGLVDSYGKDFEELYLKYEQDGLGVKTIRAQSLLLKIIASTIDTGTPYIMFKDRCNELSNQKNLGTIRGSNLCQEIIQFSSAEETATCNLASISLPYFAKNVDGKFIFDFEGLKRCAYKVCKNLNRVIDITFYPIKEAERSNTRHRPIGIGVQGLAEVFFTAGVPFVSEFAKELNSRIFETIYYGAVLASLDLAKQHGPYETFQGSPASKGDLHFDLVKEFAREKSRPFDLTYPWGDVREDVKKYGLRNSLLIAPMPTASTSNIMGNTEAFEPIKSNMFTRRVLSGDFQIVNKYLIRDLIKLGLWSEEMRQKIIAERGSIQNIDEIPNELKGIYKTVWEIKMRDLMDMAFDRHVFIDQSQSFNVYLPKPTPAQVTSMYFYAWQLGLKMGQYYLRSRSKANPVQFTVQKEMTKEVVNEEDESCLLCSS